MRKQNPAQDPKLARLVATEQRLRQQLLKQHLPRPGGRATGEE
jgi:hypothetical protein